MNTEASREDRPADASEHSPTKARARLREALRAATLGEFEIYEELGRGGMATVFLGYEIALDRYVAIKVMSPALLLEDGTAERFRREAKIAAGLNHPHIIPVYAVRETEDLAFFVMKYVDGPTLDALIKEHAPLPLAMIRLMLAQVGGALAFAHRRGVIHRDIKPGNILVDTDGWAVVTDFGIARSSGLSSLTATGAAVGTPYYMSPEQFSRTEITGRSDQYSLGVVAYEMLCGRLPFVGAGVAEVMQSHIMHVPEDILALRADCPPPLAREALHRLRSRCGLIKSDGNARQVPSDGCRCVMSSRWSAGWAPLQGSGRSVRRRLGGRSCQRRNERLRQQPFPQPVQVG